MLSSDSPSTAASFADSSPLFSGLIQQSVEGRETVDYLSAVSAFGRCVAAGPDFSVLLHDACELASLVVQADMLLVAQLTDDGRMLTLETASFNDRRKAIVERLDPISADADISMAAFALHSADVVQSEDLVAERRFTDLLLRRHQMASGIFVALCTHNRPFGALGIARKKPGGFTSHESRFTSGIGHLLASYMAQIRAEGQLRQREASMEAILDSVENLVLSLNAQGVVQDMNASARELSGFQARELRDRPFWNTLISPGSSERVATIIRQGCRPGTIATFEAELLAKDGSLRTIHWSLKAMEAGAGERGDFMLSGVDRTDLRECTKELEKYRKIALGAESAEQSMDEPASKAGPAGPNGIDKRSSPRREYSYFQRIAPVLGNDFPDDSQFVKVACCDISAGGLSYLLEEPPVYDELIISLGTPPNDRKILARVVRTAQRVVNGQTVHQVGCQFVGRVNR